MALPNGDLITTPFDPQMAYPSDRRMQVDTLNSRDSMSMFIRWEGMEVYVLENKTKYILQGGRSNEFWKEQGTGSGTGGTTFVGQFPTADLLPTSGRSAGDYAFVGTGDEFVQYNWDNIANEWVMAEGQTDMASEFFHIGYKTPLRKPVIFPLFPKDVLVDDSGDFVFSPETSVARFIFVGEVEAIRGIETAEADRENKYVNRTGSDIILRDKASGIPSGSGMDFGGTDYTWVNGSEITLKGNGTYWELAPNNQVAFSDHLDSVNAQVSVGSDGLEVISNVSDRLTGRLLSFKEVPYRSIVDGRIYINENLKTFVDAEFISKKKVYASDLGVTSTNSPETNFTNLQNACDLCAKLKFELVLQSEEESILLSQGIVLTDAHDGLVISSSGSGANLKFSNNIPATGSNTSMIQIRSTPTGHPKNIRLSNLVLDGNKSGVGVATGSGVLIYNPPGSLTLEDLNVRIDNVTTKNFIGSGIITYMPGVIINNLISYGNGSHGFGTNPGAVNVIVNNIISYENDGYGIDISGGSAIVSNAWSFKNGAGGMKHSVDTFLLTLSNIYLYDNLSVGFQQTGGSPDLELVINGMVCKDNKSRGLSVLQGKIKRLDNIILINNNTDDLATTDNQLGDCSVGHITIEDHNITDKSPIQIDGIVNIQNLIFKNNKASILLNVSINTELIIGSGLIQDNDSIPIYVSGTGRIGKIIGRDLKFIDTTVGNTQAVCVSGASAGNKIILYNPDFSQNPGPIVSGLTASNVFDLQMINPIGFDYQNTSSSSSFTLKRRNVTRHLRTTGLGDIIIPINVFESGDIVKGVIMSGNKSFTPESGLTLLSAGPLYAFQGQTWEIKFISPTSAILSVNGLKSRLARSGTNITPNISYLANDNVLTGATGTVTINENVFFEGAELTGEVEGGAKTFVAGTGVTLRYPDGQGLVAPTGSRFIIKFKSPSDALVTIIKPYATTFQALTDTPANYTGHKNKSVKVNNEETALVFVADGVDVRNITDGGSIAPTLTDGFIGSRLNFTSSTAVTLQGFTSAGGQSSVTLVNPHATNNLTLVHNGAGTVKYIDAGATDLVIAPKTAAKVEIVGNEIYRVL